MSQCSGVTSVKLTNDIIEKYPELEKKGFKTGDEIRIGAPLDGKVEGEMRQVGECSKECTMTTPTIDGQKGEFWEGEFVDEFFPKELGKIERNRKVNQCYSEPILNYTESIMMIHAGDNLSETMEALDNLKRGTANVDQLKQLRGTIQKTISKASANGENVKPLKVAIQIIDGKIDDSKVARK